MLIFASTQENTYYHKHEWFKKNDYVGLILIGIFEYSILKQFSRVLFRCCEININRGVLIFTDFVVHLDEENKNPTKYYFSINYCL